MQPNRDLAIVLKSIPYGDRNRIITALTEKNGQISAIAKNSIQSRRFGGALEPFAASEWVFTLRPGAELHSLTEAHIREPFEGLRRNFERLALASTLNELMLKLAPRNEACFDLFKLHSNALFFLNEATDKVDTRATIALLNAYLAKLLQWSGNQPQVMACLQCGTSIEKIPPQMELTCRVADAGWICTPCRHEKTQHIRNREGQTFQYSLLRLTPLAIQDFLVSLNIPIRQICAHIKASEQEHRDLFRFLEGLYVFHLPGFDKNPLKSLRFLGLESSAQPEVMNRR